MPSNYEDAHRALYADESFARLMNEPLWMGHARRVLGLDYPLLDGLQDMQVYIPNNAAGPATQTYPVTANPVYFPIVRKYANEFGIPAAGLAALISTESKWDRYAQRNGSQYKGLMQLGLDATKEAHWYINDAPLDDRRRNALYREAVPVYNSPRIFDPDVNIRYGAAYLRNLYDNYADKDLAKALLMYNRGPTSDQATHILSGAIPANAGSSYREGVNYVNHILPYMQGKQFAGVPDWDVYQDDLPSQDGYFEDALGRALSTTNGTKY